MADNPYTLVFGKEPVQMISRLSQASDIIDQFTRAHSPRLIIGRREGQQSQSPC